LTFRARSGRRERDRKRFRARFAFAARDDPGSRFLLAGSLLRRREGSPEVLFFLGGTLPAAARYGACRVGIISDRLLCKSALRLPPRGTELPQQRAEEFPERRRGADLERDHTDDEERRAEEQLGPDLPQKVGRDPADPFAEPADVGLILSREEIGEPHRVERGGGGERG